MTSESKLKKRSRWQTSRSLASSAWNVLKLDRGLAMIPVLSFIVTTALVIVLGVLFLLTVTIDQSSAGISIALPFGDTVWMRAILFIGIYMLFSFIGIYFSGALVAGLLQRFRGQTPTVASSLAAARANIGSLFKFSLLTGTVGLVLQAIEERVPMGGKVATWLVGAAWAIASMFALPVIVSSKQGIGPFAATRKSANIIKKTWGETAILNVGIGLVALLSLVAFVATIVTTGVLTASIVSATGASNLVLGVSLGTIGFIGVAGFIILSIVFTMLSSVVKAAIYHYATTDEAPEGFERDILRTSFTTKKARQVFSA